MFRRYSSPRVSNFHLTSILKGSIDSFGGGGSGSASTQEQKFGRTKEPKIRIVRPFSRNQKRPLFSLSLDGTACSEEVIIKGYALLHLLQHELMNPSPFNFNGIVCGLFL